MSLSFPLARAATAVWRLALGLPVLLLSCLMLGALLAPAAAAPPVCAGSSLIDELRDSSRLADVEAAAARTANGVGRLYRIRREGIAASFLFGTIHLSDPRALALPPAAREAFEASPRLVIETTDVLDERKAAAAMLARPDLTVLPPGRTLADLLDPQEQARVTAALHLKGVPFQSVQTLQPWLTTMSLMLPACEASRKAAGVPVLDVALAREAHAAGKPVDGLESAVEQLQAMASLPIELQVDNLLATLALQERMPDIIETMLQLYLQGRIAMITPVIEAISPDDDSDATAEAYAAFDERVVTMRNRTMSRRLRPILAGGGVFVAVGALHLPGPDGLVALLRADGFDVERVD